MSSIGMLLSAALSQAGPAQPLDLRWRAPPLCASEAALERAMRSRVGAEHLSGLRVVVEVTPTDDAEYRVELEIESPRGETRRTFDAADCATLVDAVSLIVAISADPIGLAFGNGQDRSWGPGDVFASESPGLQRPLAQDRGAHPSSTPLGVRPDPVPDAVPVEPEPEAATESIDPVAAPGPIYRVPDEELERRARVPTDLGVAARGLVGWGRVPGVDLGFGGGLALIRPRLRVELGATYFARRTATLEAENVSADISLVTGHALLCPPLWERRDLSVPLCLGVEFGAMRGEGKGGEVNASDWAPWAAASLAPRLSWRPRQGPVGLWAELGAAVPIARPAFAFEDTPTVHQSQPAVVFGGFGVEARFSVTGKAAPRQGGVR